MPGRPFPLVTGEFYHVYNRGIANQPTFLNKWVYKQAMLGLSYYRFATPPVKLSKFKELSGQERARLFAELELKGVRLVNIVSFVLMPNHFHLLLKQNTDGGVSTFLSRFTNSYVRYLNTSCERMGGLFQGRFKAVHIQTTEQLLHVSRYIHLNPLVSHVVDKSGFLSYPWSSLPQFLGKQNGFASTEMVLANFKSGDDYLRFVLDQADYGEKLEQIKHLILE